MRSEVRVTILRESGRRAIQVVILHESVAHGMIVIAHLRVVAGSRVVENHHGVGMFVIARLRVDIPPIAQIRVAATDRAVVTEVLVVTARSRGDATRSEVRIDTMAGIARRQEAKIVRDTRIDLAITSHLGETNSRDESGIRLQDLLDTPMGIRSSPPGTQTGDRWVTGRGPDIMNMRTEDVMDAGT